MLSHKTSILTVTCIIAFVAAPFAAAENTANHSAGHENLLLAQGHEQHVNRKGTYDEKTDSGHADHEKHRPHDHKMEKMEGKKNYADMILSHAEALGLSDEQLGKVVRLKLKSIQQNRKIMHQAHKSMMALRDASSSPDTDDDLLRKHAKDHADAINTLVENRINQRKAMHDILTDEQLRKLKTMKMHHGGLGSDKKDGHGHD